MEVVNQTLNSFSTQISDLAISLNLDIFETNVINIAILLGGIIYLGSDALSKGLVERQQNIIESIQEAEERLAKASSRLAEGEKQLAQAQLVIESIKKDAEKNAADVKNTILEEGKTEISRLTSAAKSQIATVESRVRKQISDYVIALALKRVTLQLQTKLGPNLQQQIIDRNIANLN
jgi:F-type H+-transporting ATPase subunit b